MKQHKRKINHLAGKMAPKKAEKYRVFWADDTAASEAALAAGNHVIRLQWGDDADPGRLVTQRGYDGV